ncbi:MAG: heme ABC exporter ATP-binding protein CcmA [Rhizobiaceae bacterium]|nr:heme ABC exporter ATP-binding protein CcmA [Rhizobiaceae bacterium]
MRLIAEALSGERHAETLFEGVSLVLDAGGALVVTGPNGAGKTTLLRILAGLLPAAGGRVSFEEGGEDFPTVAAASHWLGTGNAMKSALSLAENLDFWRAFLGNPLRGVEEALDAVGLGGLGHLPFAILSTGQKRRAAIARLLVSYRPLWLLDEPTSGLDTASETRLAELMAAHRASGGMIVAATHLPLGLDGAQELRMWA